MARSVMLSVRPEWVDKIASGDKTIEIRKTRPKMEPPFKCYIYQTMPKRGDINHMDGRVVGEFTCDRIMRYVKIETNRYDVKYMRQDVGDTLAHYLEKSDFDSMAMKPERFVKYGNGRQLYGWHISDLKVYDEPRALQSFKKWHDDGMWSHHQPITKAPQSWCYVDFVEDWNV